MLHNFCLRSVGEYAQGATILSHPEQSVNKAALIFNACIKQSKTALACPKYWPEAALEDNANKSSPGGLKNLQLEIKRLCGS